jgi:NADPH2:quinone reductase
VIGMEAAGVVEAVGAGVSEVRPGDRVAYASDRQRAYSQATVMPITRLVKLPDFIDDETAAAVILKGLTAQYLIRSAHPVSAGETILIQAAAGGVGLIMCQWARHLGARVIGTGHRGESGTSPRRTAASPIVYTQEDIVARVRALTGGQLLWSTAVLAARSRRRSVVCVAAACACRTERQEADPFDLFRLNRMGSLMTSAGLADYCIPEAKCWNEPPTCSGSEKRHDAHLDQSALSACRRGARIDLEARRTVGSSVLLP